MPPQKGNKTLLTAKSQQEPWAEGHGAAKRKGCQVSERREGTGFGLRHFNGPGEAKSALSGPIALFSVPTGTTCCWQQDGVQRTKGERGAGTVPPRDAPGGTQTPVAGHGEQPQEWFWSTQGCFCPYIFVVLSFEVHKTPPVHGHGCTTLAR